MAAVERITVERRIVEHEPWDEHVYQEMEEALARLYKQYTAKKQTKDAIKIIFSLVIR